jgi:hypothetical protein
LKVKTVAIEKHGLNHIFFSFKQRSIRGIPADVWVAESPSKNENDEQYMTVELFFSHVEWNVLVEEVNPNTELPMGMRTYMAESV